LAVGSPLAAAAAAVWGRARERRAAAGAQQRASPCSTPTPTSALSAASLAASTAPGAAVAAATVAPASRHDAVVGGAVGGVERRGGVGVDAFAVTLYNVRGKVSALKGEHLTAEHSRSWLSLWRGKVQTSPPIVSLAGARLGAACERVGNPPGTAPSARSSCVRWQELSTCPNGAALTCNAPVGALAGLRQQSRLRACLSTW
jgi:hypothetical protein